MRKTLFLVAALFGLLLTVEAKGKKDKTANLLIRLPCGKLSTNQK